MSDASKWRFGGIAIAALFGLILISGIAVRLARSHEVRQWTLDNEEPTVSVFKPDQKLSEQALVLPATVRAFNEAQIYARVPGYVKSWAFDIGAHVHEGDVLALIDTPELDQQIQQARADLEMSKSARSLSKVTADRWATLLPLDAVSKQAAQEKAEDLAAKSSAVKAAEASLERLRTLKAFARITAPFDGIVTERNVDIGSLVSGTAGTGAHPLFAVSDLHALRVYVQVPQSFSPRISTKTKALLCVPEYPDRKFAASLLSTSNAINPQSGTLLVELQVDNADQTLKPGDYGQVSFSLHDERQSLFVPASALLFRSGGLEIATLGGANRVVLKKVQVARDLGTQVELASGLLPHDRIIDNPPDSLATGDRVRVAAASSGGH